jgi:tetratricopeptide (TPR) repeat protein
MKLLIALTFLATPEAPYLAVYLERIETTTARYKDCVSLIVKDVDVGRVAAQRWAVEGGGAPAQHCVAIADLAAGYPRLAAVRLTEIAERTDAGDKKTRARLLAEATLAFLESGDHSHAEETVAAARRAAPGLPEIDFIAAKTFAASEKWEAAVEAVTTAEKAGLKLGEAYLIRARAHQALGRPVEAADDVVAALTLDPFNVDALVLRGELQQAGVKIEAYYGEPADKTK